VAELVTPLATFKVPRAFIRSLKSDIVTSLVSPLAIKFRELSNDISILKKQLFFTCSSIYICIHLCDAVGHPPEGRTACTWRRIPRRDVAPTNHRSGEGSVSKGSTQVEMMDGHRFLNSAHSKRFRSPSPSMKPVCKLEYLKRPAVFAQITLQ